MTSCGDPEGGVVLSSVDDVDATLREARDVPRALRRRVVSDARAGAARVQADGFSADRVRFRLLRCVDCGCLELSCFGVGARVHH